jgi:4-amino-4-deoxy-L-arabinose transferase-like glycosyltransferase
MNLGTSVDGSTTTGGSGNPPDWWHRDHPTFTALAGFFSGMLFVTVVPGGFVGILRLLFEYETAEDLFPFVLITLVVPIALLAVPRSRRFGQYMVLGMVLTALVVLGVASLVLYFMVRADG